MEIVATYVVATKKHYKTLSYWSDFIAIAVVVSLEGMVIPRGDQLPWRGWTSHPVIEVD